MIMLLEGMVKMAYGYKKVKSVFSNTFVKVALYILLADMILTYLGFIQSSFIGRLYPF